MALSPGTLQIGSQIAPNSVLLAQISGVTDLPYRRLAHHLGAGVVVSEMVASEELVREHIEGMLSHYGMGLGLRNGRKHIGWYLESSERPAGIVKAWRRRMCTDDNAGRVLSGLDEFYDDAREAAA